MDAAPYCLVMHLHLPGDGSDGLARIVVAFVPFFGYEIGASDGIESSRMPFSLSQAPLELINTHSVNLEEGSDLRYLVAGVERHHDRVPFISSVNISSCNVLSCLLEESR